MHLNFARPIIPFSAPLFSMHVNIARRTVKTKRLISRVNSFCARVNITDSLAKGEIVVGMYEGPWKNVSLALDVTDAPRSCIMRFYSVIHIGHWKRGKRGAEDE